MKLGIPGLALATSAALFGISVATAQTAPPGPLAFAAPPHKNLKILPVDLPAPQLLATMKFFSQSLGVRCTFCHVGVHGQPLSTIDFPADSKPEKQTARRMIIMVQQINQQGFGITDPSKYKVTCFTCHRGSQHPETRVPLPEAPPTPPKPA